MAWILLHIWRALQKAQRAEVTASTSSMIKCIIPKLVEDTVILSNINHTGIELHKSSHIHIWTLHALRYHQDQLSAALHPLKTRSLSTNEKHHLTHQWKMESGKYSHGQQLHEQGRPPHTSLSSLRFRAVLAPAPLLILPLKSQRPSL